MSPIIKIIWEVPEYCNFCIKNEVVDVDERIFKCSEFNAILTEQSDGKTIRCQECKDAEAQYKKDEEETNEKGFAFIELVIATAVVFGIFVVAILIFKKIIMGG